MLEEIGQFRIERLVGRGGMGLVYRALDTKLRRRVALKVIRAERAADPVQRERTRREARALSRLNHPNVCQVYDLLERPDGDVLVVEWIEGRSLADVLVMHGPLPAGEALRVIEAVAGALVYAHAHGVVHRDLKPANVMRTEDGAYKVLDFGLARLAAEPGETVPMPFLVPTGEADPAEPGLTRNSRVIGTPGYIAPEDARGEKSGDKIDVFGLGVTAYELVSGRLPFSGSATEMIRESATGRVRPLEKAAPEVSRRHRGLTALIHRMLASDPEARPSAIEVAAQARELLAAPVRRRRLLAGAAFLAALLLIGLAASVAMRPAVPGVSRGRPAVVAILPVENRTGAGAYDAVIRTGLPELIASGLRHDEKVSVLPGAAVARALAALVPAGRAPTDAERRTLAHRLSARLLVEGRVVKAGASTVLDVELRDARGVLVRSGTVRSGEGAFAQTLASGAAAVLLKAIDPLGASRVGAAAPIPQAALADYAAAVEASRRGDKADAHALAVRAAYAAPGFAPAPSLAADVADDLERRDEALLLAHWALGVARARGDREIEVFALRRLGELAGRSGDGAGALARLTEARTVAEASEDPLALARVSHALALFHFRRGEPVPMERAARTAMEIAREADQKDLEARVSVVLGTAVAYQGRRAEAKALYRHAAELARDVENVETEALALTNIGGLQLDEGELAAGEEAWRRSAELFRKLGDHGTVIVCTLNLGEAALRRGDVTRSEALYREALSGADGIRDVAMAQLAEAGLAEVLLARGDLPAAEAAARSVLASTSRAPAFSPRVAALSVLEGAAEARGDAPGALVRGREAAAAVEGTAGAAAADRALALVALARALLAQRPPAVGEARGIVVALEALGERPVDLALLTVRVAALAGDRTAALAALERAGSLAAKREPRRRADVERLRGELGRP